MSCQNLSHFLFFFFFSLQTCPVRLCKRAADRNGLKTQNSLWERTDRSPVCSGSFKASPTLRARGACHRLSDCIKHKGTCVSDQSCHSSHILHSSTSLSVHSLSICIALSSSPHYRLVRSSQLEGHRVTVCRRFWPAVLSTAHTCAMWCRYASSGG